MRKEMQIPKIIIKTDGIRAKVIIDNKEMKGLRGYSLCHDA